MNEWVEAERAWIIGKWEWLKKPKKPTFLIVHYTYMVGWIIIGSILIYPAGGMAYIDALFFAAGASTQSGLNTLNINQMNTEQQFWLYMIAMFTNPIVIHSAVVFVRLYWFEKRFQHIVQEATTWRATRTKSRTATQVDEERATKAAGDQGVRGRSIVVLHEHSRKPSPQEAQASPDEKLDPDQGSSSSDGNKDGKLHASRPQPLASDRFKREVVFADQMMNSPSQLSPDIRLPESRPPEQHIEFVERQRNPKDKGALRIPGPRDFDRGEVPERVDDEASQEYENDNALVGDDEKGDGAAGDERGEKLRRQDSDHGASHIKMDVPPRRTITIDAPTHPRLPHLQTQQSRVTYRGPPATGSRAITDSEEPPRTARPRPRSNTLTSFFKATSTQHDQPVPYLSWQPTIGRNSAFVDLTEEQREELGGIEYRSLKTLAIVLISYFFFWHIMGVVVFVPWIILTEPWGSIVDADGVNRIWWGIFSPATLFNDLGFTLTPDSFISFNTAVVPLLLGSILIVVGNTGFPCMLRVWIWALQKVFRRNEAVWEELRFLLDHPRRCFTLLFPSAATWVLFAILILLNGVDVVFYIILDLNDPTVTSVSPGFRVLNGLFQATSTRTSGTAVVNLADLHPGIQVSYLIMMYISVFPIAISMRRTNVYEERSLGVYGTASDEEDDEHERSYIGAHLRRQLSFDLWFIFLGLFVIAIAEGGRIADPNDPSFTLFNCLFEIVSAYGTVGLSLGYPNIDESFSAEFTVVSKLVIVGMMIRGRHRGLPYEVDRAILLPSENLNKKEDQDAARRNRRLSINSPPTSAVMVEDDSGVGYATGRAQPHVGHPHPRQDLGKMLAGLARADASINE